MCRMTPKENADLPSGPAVGRSTDEGVRFARRMYPMRIIGLGLGAIAVAGGLYEVGAPGWVWALLVVNALAWPHVAYRIARGSRDPYRAELRNLMLDSASGGAWIAAMHFNAAPGAVIIAMLAMDKAALGGWRFLARCFAAEVAGALAVMLVARIEPQIVFSGMLARLTVLPLLFCYPVIVGLTAHWLARQVRRQNELLAALSTIDGLTRLLNRMHWEQAVAHEFQRCRRIGHSSSVMMLDIDHFKSVNDVHGHQAGDAALRAVARILRDTLRAHDVAGRYGGEEFGVVLPGTGRSGAAAIAERVRRRIEGAVLDERQGVRATVSIGYAALSADDKDYGAWIARADRALYAAKAAGRNRSICGDELRGQSPDSSGLRPQTS